MTNLSPATQKLIKQYQVWYQSLQIKEGLSTIHVDEVASAIASFYEKIRGVIDWKEEHLLRKSAIERNLKRKLLLPTEIEEISESLVLELIRSGHFPNDKIEENKIKEVKKSLEKYLFIINNAGNNPEKLKAELSNWLFSLAACEIEEILAPAIRETALINYMTELMTERIEVRQGKIIQKKIPKEEKEIQVYIACQKALFKLDDNTISYYLLIKKYPQWFNLSENQLKEISQNIYLVWEEINKELHHPLAEKFYKICEKYDTAYLILGDVIAKDPPEAENKLKQPELLENFIKECYQKRLEKLKGRMSRAAIYSTISIFVTKILLALAIEIPFDKYFLGGFNKNSLIFNVAIPPLLMFFLVLTIKPPTKENLNMVMIEVMKIVYEKEEKDNYIIKTGKKRGFFLTSLVFLFYLFSFIFSFGVIIWGLKKLNFGLLSIIIFLLFFSLIAFAGLKIRQRSKELNIMEEKTGFLGFLIDIFSMPFVRVGRWLSQQWSRFNIVMVIITALIDMPFHLFVEFLENWRSFLKEKKEEIH